MLTLKHSVLLVLVGIFCLSASNSIGGLFALRAELSEVDGAVLLAVDTQSTAANVSADEGINHANGVGMDGSAFSQFRAQLAASSTPLFKAAAALMVQEETRAKCDLEAAKQQVSWNKGDGRRRDIGICLQIKNDAAILDEYVAFHWLQVSGIEHRKGNNGEASLLSSIRSTPLTNVCA